MNSSSESLKMVAKCGENESEAESKDGEPEMNNNALLDYRNISEIYLQISRKGILSYYGDMEKWTPPVPPPEDNNISEGGLDPRFSAVRLSIFDPGNTVPLKPSVIEAVRDLDRCVLSQTVLSLIRNAGCYAFLACATYLAIEGHRLFHDLQLKVIDGRIAVLVFLVLGFVTVPFQIIHILSELKPGSPSSLVGAMLRNQVTHAKFLETVTQLRSAAPYVGAEVRLSTGSLGRKLLPNEAARKLDTVFLYDSWADNSLPLAHTRWPDDASGWIILGKDYQLSGANSVTWINDETNKFKASVSNLRKGSGMTFDYVLDLQEGVSFPDAQAYLVHPDTESSQFYHFQVYRNMLLLCLDSIYNVLFHVRTRRFDDYVIVKVLRGPTDPGLTLTPC